MRGTTSQGNDWLDRNQAARKGQRKGNGINAVKVRKKQVVQRGRTNRKLLIGELIKPSPTAYCANGGGTNERKKRST